jgi:hypothetical protein
MMTPAAPACWEFLAFCTKEHPPRSTMRMKGDGQGSCFLVAGSMERDGNPEEGLTEEASHKSVSV